MERAKYFEEKVDNLNAEMGFDQLLDLEIVGQKGREKLNEIKDALGSESFDFLHQLKRKFGPDVTICLVGGIVRDSINGQKAKDYDFIISFNREKFGNHQAARESFEQFFIGNGEGAKEITYKKKKDGSGTNDIEKYIIRSRWGKMVLAGENYGVYKLNLGQPVGEVDIAFPRRERALDDENKGGRANFDIQSDATMPIEEDLGRRDLNINAMGLVVDFKENPDGTMETILKFRDIFDGLSSIKEKKIKTAGNPYERLTEDMSRIPRVFRFAIKLGYEIDQEICSAMEKIIEEDRVNKKDSNGKYLLKRENLSAEFLKSLDIDPIRTLNYYTREITKSDGTTTSLLQEIMPGLFDKRGASSGINQDDLEKTRELKNELYQETIQMFELAQKQEIGLSISEKIAVMFMHSGKIPELEIYNKRKSHRYYPGNWKVANKIFTDNFEAMRMSALLPSARHLTPDKTDISRIITEIPVIYGWLGQLNLNEKSVFSDLKAKDIIFMNNHFSQGTEDGLLKVLGLLVQVSPNVTEETKIKLGKVQEFLEYQREILEDKIGGKIHEKFDEIFKTSYLQNIFFIKPGPAYVSLMRKARVAYMEYLRNLSPKDPYDVDLAKDYIFETIASAQETKDSWAEFLTDSLFSNFFSDDEKDLELQGILATNFSSKVSQGRLVKDFKKRNFKEIAKREVIALIEQSVYQAYAGKSYESFLKSYAHARKDVGNRGNLLRQSFLRQLLKDPARLMDSIEQDMQKEGKGKYKAGDRIIAEIDGYRKKKPCLKFFDIWLGELTAMYKTEQSPNYHQEGDVWMHTKLCLMAMKDFERKELIDVSILGALILLIHDIEKPNVMRINEKTGNLLFSGHENIELQKLKFLLERMGIENASKRAQEFQGVIGNHMKMFARWKNAENKRERADQFDESKKFNEIYQLFPDGTKDLLYFQIICDAKASIGADGRDKYMAQENNFFELRKILEEIDSMRKTGISFEEFKNDPEAGFLIKNIQEDFLQMNVYRIFSEFMNRSGAIEKGKSKKDRIKEFIYWIVMESSEFGAAKQYFKNKFALSEKIIDFYKNGKSEILSKKEIKKIVNRFLSDERIKKIREAKQLDCPWLEREFFEWLKGFK